LLDQLCDRLQGGNQFIGLDLGVRSWARQVVPPGFSAVTQCLRDVPALGGPSREPLRIDILLGVKVTLGFSQRRSNKVKGAVFARGMQGLGVVERRCTGARIGDELLALIDEIANMRGDVIGGVFHGSVSGGSPRKRLLTMPRRVASSLQRRSTHAMPTWPETASS
jgi:hypothetical protein